MIRSSDIIGYVAAEKEQYEITRCVSASYSSYGGTVTRLQRNCFGDLSVSTTFKKPRIWKKFSSAKAYCDEHNAKIDKWGRGGNCGEVSPTAVYPNDETLREEIRRAVWDRDTLKAVAAFFTNNKNLGGY